MARFLSDEWLEELNAALGELPERSGNTAPLVVQHLIEHPCGPSSALRVAIDSNGARASREFDPDADVTYRLDYETALGIAEGKRDAHEEFLLRRLTFDGEPSFLLSHVETLAWLQSCLASKTQQAQAQRQP